MKPLVSIVTPSYNQAQFLESTIRSVLAQDYPALEYFVIDGASTDGSPEIIKKFSNRITEWVSEPDRGQSHAINKGFKRTTGEIVAWLNSDDLLLPGAVSESVEIFLKNPQVGMVFGNAISADAEGKPLSEIRFEDRDISDFLQFKMICQPAVFFRRDLLEKVGFLNEDLHFFLDHQLWIRMARETELIHQPNFWAVSRYHSEAKNVTLADQCGDEVWQILNWAENLDDLKALMKRDRLKIQAGANQIIARYLLDAGHPGKAFRSYLIAARSWLPSLKSYWLRFLFSGLSMLGLGFLGSLYYRLKRKYQVPRLDSKELANWPGIQV